MDSLTVVMLLAVVAVLFGVVVVAVFYAERKRGFPPPGKTRRQHIREWREARRREQQ